MSDHQTSYALNTALGRLYLHNRAFRSLSAQDQQGIALDLIRVFQESDTNISEILSNECFLEESTTNETRTIATILNICAYCAQAKGKVQDYGDRFSSQGLCPDCAQKIGLDTMG
jgi:hypothetical protein